MACDISGLLASGSHRGVISLVQTGRQATGTTMRLLPPHHRLSDTSSQTIPAHNADSR